MAYEALARKYRPRTFDEVVGQEPIVRTLTNALRERRIHHAYVFSGMRGVGKTTVARIFAKALNCEKGPTPTPCLACDPCVEIAAGRDLDVIEMDAASRTGVDDVRDLIDTTRYAPARDRYKVFIIDEFHMLSKPAFNALLKTLEEPPPRVVFVMATTELHKVLPTVLSRTQQFDFRKVALKETVDQLARIAEKEGVTVSRPCLEMLARAGEGSVRDAESLLDQAIAFCGLQLHEPELRSLLGLVPDEVVESFLTAASRRDGAALVRLIADVITEGHDLRVFHAGLIEGVRRLLLLRTLESPSEILGLSPEHETRLAALAGSFAPESLLRIFSILAGLEGPLKYSDQPRYLLEAAAIRIAAVADLSPIEELISRFESDGSEPGPERGPGTRSGPAPGGSRRGAPLASAGPGSGRGQGPGPPAGSQKTGSRAQGREAEAPSGGEGVETATRMPRSGTLARGQGSGTPISGSIPASQAAPAPPPSRPAEAIHPADAARLPADPTRRFLEAVGDEKETLAILIEHAASFLFEDRCVVLSFDDSQAFARKSVEQAENLAILSAAAGKVSGFPMTVRIARLEQGRASPSGDGPRRHPAKAGDRGASGDLELESDRSAEAPPFARALVEEAQAGAEEDLPPDEAPIPAAQSNGPVSSAVAEATGARQKRIQALALEDPAVKGIMERFGARIVEIKEVP